MSKAETDVQFFSHLNGISLDNKWGEMINLLDTCLVNGLTLPNISDATITDDGRMTVNFKSAHNCLLFQCVTLSGCSPSTFNDKYRIVGVPSTTQLLLSTNLTAQTATTVGTAVLSPLGYEIVFSANTKRVYRALNPTAQHPFIRVDESRASTDGTNVYDDSYAKSAMVGLIENMTHIDDYQDPNKLQLPLDTSDFTKNWKISGTGLSVVRGWSKWYWASASDMSSGLLESASPSKFQRAFTLIGNSDCFYLLNALSSNTKQKQLKGVGIYNNCLPSDIIPNWVLLTTFNRSSVNSGAQYNNIEGFTPLLSNSDICAQIYTPKYKINQKIVSNISCYAVSPDRMSGYSNLYSSNSLAALEFPIYDTDKFLKGSLKHIYYSGNSLSLSTTMPLLQNSSMYIADSAYGGMSAGFYFYLGELN